MNTRFGGAYSARNRFVVIEKLKNNPSGTSAIGCTKKTRKQKKKPQKSSNKQQKETVLAGPKPVINKKSSTSGKTSKKSEVKLLGLGL